ncbi:hypothetical protein D3C85_498670 [compost metagenome]
MIQHADRRVDHVVELAVGNQYLGLAMLEHEGDGLCIQPHVEGVEDRADHRHAKVHFEHRRDIGQHHRHGIALADAATGQGRGQASAARIGLGPVTANSAMNHGGVVGIDACRTLEKTQGREGDVVGRGRRKALFIDRHSGTHGRLFALVCPASMRPQVLVFTAGESLYTHQCRYGSKTICV